MADTIKLRQLDEFKSLSSPELEILRFNFWLIEQGLNSVGAATPLVPGSGGGGSGTNDHHLLINLATFDDHPQYAYLAGRSGGQTLTGGLISSDSLTLASFTSAPLGKIIVNSGTIQFGPTTDYCSMVFGGARMEIGSNESYPARLYLHGLSSAAPTLMVSSVAGQTSATIYSYDYVLGAGAGGSTFQVSRDHEVSIRAKANKIGLVITQGTSNTADLQRWLDVAGTTTLLNVNKNGNFVDNTFKICDDGDITKLVAFQCSGITTGNTRTLTIPDASGTIALTTDPVTGHNILSATHSDTLADTVVRGDLIIGNATPKWARLPKGTALQVLMMDGTATDIIWTSIGTVAIDYIDSTFRIIDNVTPTKKLAFECSGITAATTRTLTVPNASGTIAILSGISQTWAALNTHQNLTVYSTAFKLFDPGGIVNGQFDISFNTADRAYTLPDYDCFLVGNINPISLSNQSADIGATNIGSPSNGVFLLVLILETTTADVTAGILTVTIGWTDDAGATTDATTTLTLATLGRKSTMVPLYRASGNITYAVTHTGGYGTAKYALKIRTMTLG